MKYTSGLNCHRATAACTRKENIATEQFNLLRIYDIKEKKKGKTNNETCKYRKLFLKEVGIAIVVAKKSSREYAMTEC